MLSRIVVLELARANTPYGVSPVWAALTAAATAEWATIDGRADADALWAEAERLQSALGLVPATVRARVRHARLLLPNGCNRARTLLERAWMDADTTGMTALRDDAERTGGGRTSALDPRWTRTRRTTSARTRGPSARR